MKKTVFYATSLLFLLVTLLSSCNKEPKELKLEGTTWEGSFMGGLFDNSHEDARFLLRLVFSSDKAGLFSIKNTNAEDPEQKNIKFTYVINGHNVRITFAPELADFFGTSSTTFDAKYNSTLKTLTLKIGVLPWVFSKVS
ncbi:hypothetical protein [Porphyromonas circumdentaria]|uniref:Lipoprotein n=1 Tax=Porphyromonas circumdentaria TaxID=29524 RepID=A0A1T4PRH1_9PORP|nr:hypothetical protein [Porphyromonas circumdentaria]MBB6276447.1 hypothetical protein [Porphyromonas circumdentaria]MDO4723121.1 hypothetical protein [Porphyromonas circumdentaria]SJZ93508.1 hypothetical protein SAMN02745171_01541 [Porphyromonas circumdentaria]